MNTVKHSILPGLAGVVLGVVYAIAFMALESQAEIIGLLVFAVVIVVVAKRFGLTQAIANAYQDHEMALNTAVIIGVLVTALWFREDHFPLLMMATVMIYTVACLGLNLQFGYTGMVNFSGSAFFGIGCYTAAVLTAHSAIPHILIIVIGGCITALIGSVLILPVLRTRGHYAAVVTIAFGILFKTFLEVNDTLGGPQGLQTGGMELFGWAFNGNIEINDDIELSFYLNYVVFALLMLVGAFTLIRRIERSWIGLNLDAVRLDETAAACFGINIKRWKITAFTLGNFLAGMAGAIFAMMLGFIAPSNFAFSDSLILVSIILLGGLGSPWGTILAAALVVLLPEKLQAIQEYRFLLYAGVVILILLFRPQGLLPRQLRTYIPGWRP